MPTYLKYKYIFSLFRIKVGSRSEARSESKEIEKNILLKVLFIWKHGRGLNQVPGRTCIIAQLNNYAMDVIIRVRLKM